MRPLFGDEVVRHYGEPRESTHIDERMNWTLDYIKRTFPTGQFKEPLKFGKNDTSTLND